MHPLRALTHVRQPWTIRCTGVTDHQLALQSGRTKHHVCGIWNICLHLFWHHRGKGRRWGVGLVQSAHPSMSHFAFSCVFLPFVRPLFIFLFLFLCHVCPQDVSLPPSRAPPLSHLSLLNKKKRTKTIIVLHSEKKEKEKSICLWVCVFFYSLENEKKKW